MPVFFLEAPPGIHTDAKKRMVEKITAALDEAYPSPPTPDSSFANTRSRTWARTGASNRSP